MAPLYELSFITKTVSSYTGIHTQIHLVAKSTHYIHEDELASSHIYHSTILLHMHRL